MDPAGNGLLNGILTGLGYDKVPFMVDASWARFWVVGISVWAFMGFYTLILLAGLQAIPAELYEAAQTQQGTEGSGSGAPGPDAAGAATGATGETDEKVVDADFEVVDDDKKSSS